MTRKHLGKDADAAADLECARGTAPVFQYAG
jgi:hypothetical protein